MAFRVQIRRDTELNWNTNDPILLDGESGYEIDSGRFKIGNGIDVWSVLPYISGSGGGATGPTGPTGGISSNFYYQPGCPTGDVPEGSFWYDSYNGSLFLRIYDSPTDQNLWVTPSADCCSPSFFYSPTCPPIYPGSISEGSLWFNNASGKMAVYIYDSIHDQYLWTTPSVECCPMNLNVEIEVLNYVCDYVEKGGILIEFYANVTGGLPDYSYEWSFPQIPEITDIDIIGSSTENTFTISGSFFDSFLLRVKVTDSRGNITKETILVSPGSFCGK